MDDIKQVQMAGTVGQMRPRLGPVRQTTPFKAADPIGAATGLTSPKFDAAAHAGLIPLERFSAPPIVSQSALPLAVSGYRAACAAMDSSTP
ncbi:hypothetical protein [Puniceibacterium sp. IMCC21224]|uniref:hypothetical protein n=1 Tax=Puniceibacterium sp. IMCC21224 TaxID=1618204 RepID=UPI00064D96C0|nr:hypothetical protein [Puniceibacterium sp. IMCC21224]KMK67413.1 hypothetical protein IMCC21224_112282 [Puniceibacterium sp. IMCC21224]